MPISIGNYCGKCLSNPPIRHRTQSLFRYYSPVDRLISDLKYRGQLHLISYFADTLTQVIEHKNEQKPQLLIPIPLHSQRLRQRGYNQSAELAKKLALNLNITFDNSALIRIKNTLPQAQLPFDERKKNMQNAFQSPSRSLPEHIALVDDVLTTGFTADMAAKACLKNGAKKVEIWTIARTISEYD